MVRPNHQSSRGAVAVIVAIVATLLICAMAFAIDLGYAWQARRTMVKATDAAALAAAADVATASTAATTADCSTGVATTAKQYLASNASNSTYSFCVTTAGAAHGQSDTTTGHRGLGAQAPGGTVTVGGTSVANFSFARIFGLNSTTIHSSTTVAWKQATVVPMFACVGTNQQPSSWFASATNSRGNGTTSVRVAQQWSGSASAAACTSGNSGSYGMLDLANVASSSTNFSTCTADPSLSGDYAAWLSQGTNAVLAVGDYVCGRVGQTFGASVDGAICSLRGQNVIVPLVDRINETTIAGTGKVLIAHIAGFAMAELNDYTPIDGSNGCGNAGLATMRAPEAPRVRMHTIAARRTIRPAAAQDPTLAVTVAPATAVAGDNVTGTATITNPRNGNTWSGTLTLNFAGPLPTSITVSPSGVCGYSTTGSNTATISCPGLSVGAGGSRTITFLATYGSAGSGTISGSLSGVAATDSAAYTITPAPTTTTTQPIRSVAVTVAGAGTGSVVATANGQATQTCTTGTCTWTYPSFTQVTLTASPTNGSTFTGWSGDGTCSGSASTCTLTIPAALSRAVTATFGAAPTTTTTTAPPLATFRILTMTFIEADSTTGSAGYSGAGLLDSFNYKICAINLTRTEALTPPNTCPSTTITCNGDYVNDGNCSNNYGSWHGWDYGSDGHYGAPVPGSLPARLVPISALRPTRPHTHFPGRNLL